MSSKAVEQAQCHITSFSSTTIAAAALPSPPFPCSLPPLSLQFILTSLPQVLPDLRSRQVIPDQPFCFASAPSPGRAFRLPTPGRVGQSSPRQALKFQSYLIPPAGPLELTRSIQPLFHDVLHLIGQDGISGALPQPALEQDVDEEMTDDPRWTTEADEDIGMGPRQI
ncbi:hypothetical protein B0H14DRAFT_3520985 [Mycena olivaceomarginata]|nr:hypothetical protein B0H14DRAFT_3520985 [Mycena olivaceomarginata]